MSLKPDIPGYRILRRLGHGGMSEIWLAEQIALARPVAVKIVSPGDEAEARLARFRQEASLIARFDHPHVVGIIEFGETADGRLFFTMPYVPNGTLAEAGLRGDSPRLREVLSQVLEALAYVHEHGVVHRDVKPENVLFDNVGRARLADFGVSRSMAGVSRYTRVGETFGSSLYMSPEQARGEVPDGRSDLYSLGAVAYELLTGRPPYEGPDHLSVVVAHLQSPVPRLPEHLQHWQAWIDTALAKRPEHRYANADAMRNALARIPQDASAHRRLRVKQGLLTWGLPVLIVLTLAVAAWRFSIELSPAIDSPAQEGEQNPGVGTGAATVQVPPAASLNPVRGGGGSVLPAGEDVPLPIPDSDPGADVPSRDVAPAGDGNVPLSERAPEPVEASPVARARGLQSRDESLRRHPGPKPPSEPSTSAPETRQPMPFAATFEAVPKIPLFLLSGSRDEQLRRIEEYLEHGRRAINADRANVENLRRATTDRDHRRRLRDGYDDRKANYEAWRRQLLTLREKVEDAG